MKKTLLACLTASLFVLSGCEDKVLTEKLANAEKQIQQLTTDKTAIQAELSKKENELAELKKKQQESVPALQVEIVELFNKAEKIKHAKDPKDEFGVEESNIDVFVSTAKTGVEWLDQLLIGSILGNSFDETKQNPSYPKQQDVVDKFEKIYGEFVEEAKEYKPLGLSTTVEMNYIGQRNNIITFVKDYYSYTGGAHGVGHSTYLNIDIKRKAVIKLDDLVSPTQQNKLKELLWERYTEDRRDENGKINTFTEKRDFEIAQDFYFTEYGISFVYPVYALGPYAEGEVKLELYFYQINDLLNKAYQRTKQDGFKLNPIEF